MYRLRKFPISTSRIWQISNYPSQCLTSCHVLLISAKLCTLLVTATVSSDCTCMSLFTVHWDWTYRDTDLHIWKTPAVNHVLLTMCTGRSWKLKIQKFHVILYIIYNIKSPIISSYFSSFYSISWFIRFCGLWIKMDYKSAGWKY